ncbi:MarR family winged helix-turn-helix transcriptional regulator [Anatilimnocola sp. NA78]|uniref:MarR family winged helix-turn-helix transcriptional regulator n=1 Tax=Anatilimnocola sp. NA78 TaxID=3415683 RepID=UPI003CE45817
MPKTQVGPGRTELRDWLQLLLQTGAASRSWRQQLAEQIAGHELTDQEFLVLWLCDERPQARRGQGDLAEAVGASPAQMSGLVERLRRRNLLCFERLGRDRRRQVWQLTDDGQQLLTELCRSLSSRREHPSNRLTCDEQRQLLELIERSLTGDASDNDSPSPLTLDQGGPSSCAA